MAANRLEATTHAEPAKTLTHGECVRLIRSPVRYRPVLAAIDGQEPVPLSCFVLDDGDLLVPAGRDRTLIRRASGRPVAITVTERNLHAPGGWTVTGIGLARPLVAAERPDPLPRATTREDFDTGLRVVIARFTGATDVR
ncbi:hypothetical protein [Amycolatopsis pithecellobii]|uniref:Pyridoxamine 5'-phosphate oxidase family protein n=1 Tax=Amycolatopsis pithecellobii TaxID=664692 RepID=A0A6N7YKH3_9PSEU|nr:hypothetical protein [Amycolatopsis pithecellobii]MTD53415.1 hypothetical protein [Amycolatopsis pithecellobii]